MIFKNFKKKIEYLYFCRLYYLLRYHKLFSLLLIISISFFQPNEATLLSEVPVTENHDKNIQKLIVNLTIGLVGTILLVSFLQANFLSIPQVDPNSIPKDLIKLEVQDVLNDIIETIIKSSESSPTVPLIVGTINVLSSIDCPNVVPIPTPQVLPVIIPQPSPPINELILNSKQFYDSFFNRLDLPNLLANPPEQLPQLGEEFKRKKELLQEHVERYNYNHNTVRNFVQDVLLRYLSLYKGDFNLLMSYYKQLAYELYVKANEINLLEFKSKYIFNICSAPFCEQNTFSVNDLVKHVVLSAFFGLHKFFYLFFHKTLHHLSCNFSFNLIGFQETDLRAPIRNNGLIARPNINSLVIGKCIYEYPSHKYPYHTK